MSAQLSLPGFDGVSSVNRPTAIAIRASIAREMRYLLTISRDASRPYHVREAGVAHSLGVCLIEDYNLARGVGKGSKPGNAATMPRFVDVKLDSEAREQFLEWYSPDADQVRVLQDFADSGYRVGVTWSGEHQSYTVSATCRDTESENNGLCMTAFSGSLPKAIALLWFKHAVVCGYRWSNAALPPSEEFG